MYKLSIILLITLSTSISAQDQLAKEILDRLAKSTKSYNNITIDFDFKYNININDLESGTLIIEGNKFIIEMDNQTIINNGETQWIHLKEVNEVQIMEHDSGGDIISPNKLLTIYEGDYKYTYVETKLINGKQLQIINLFPKKSQEFIKINIGVDPIKNQLKRMLIYDKGGGIYTYLIKSFKSNTNIKPFSFNISDFPNVEVIDLR